MMNKQLKENSVLIQALAKYIESMVNYVPTRDQNGVIVPDDFTNYYIEFFLYAVNEAVSQ